MGLTTIAGFLTTPDGVMAVEFVYGRLPTSVAEQ